MVDLIARLEKATGPDRELDRSIWELVDPADSDAAKVNPYDRSGQSRWPHYTSSIDAALTLVPEAQNWSLHTEPAGHFAKTWRGNPPQYFYGQTDGVRVEVSSAAIALCIAALKARAPLTTTEER